MSRLHQKIQEIHREENAKADPITNTYGANIRGLLILDIIGKHPIGYKHISFHYKLTTKSYPVFDFVT